MPNYSTLFHFCFTHKAFEFVKPVIVMSWKASKTLNTNQTEVGAYLPDGIYFVEWIRIKIFVSHNNFTLSVSTRNALEDFLQLDSFAL